jgi:amino acid transporter
LISLAGAFCYAELASTYPSAGGEYHFLTRAYGKRLAFLFAWSRLTILQTGSIALAAFVFGDYLGTSDADSKAVVAAYRSRDTASPYWKDVQRIEQVNPLNYVAKDSPPALILCGGLDPANVILNCSAFFDKYIEKGAVASYYALSTGTHVRVGSAIEQAAITWHSERLSANPPPLYPDAPPAQQAGR